MVLEKSDIRVQKKKENPLLQSHIDMKIDSDS